MADDARILIAAGFRPEELERLERAAARQAMTPAEWLRAVLARHPETLVVEDDHAAELAGVPLSPLAGTTSAWAFVRSLSKPYGPDLRLAVLAGDEAMTEKEKADSIQRLLARAADWVRPGGRLVYAVCSLEREEGEAVADAFGRGRGDYRVEPPAPGELPDWARADARGFVRLLPSALLEHGGADGFFFARFRREG